LIVLSLGINGTPANALAFVAALPLAVWLGLKAARRGETSDVSPMPAKANPEVTGVSLLGRGLGMLSGISSLVGQIFAGWREKRARRQKEAASVPKPDILTRLAPVRAVGPRGKDARIEPVLSRRTPALTFPGDLDSEPDEEMEDENELA